MALTRRRCLQAATVVASTRAVSAAWAAPAVPPAPQRPTVGRVERWDAFASRHVDPRPVEVWLPPGYDPQARRYAVLYMHDGQMLFDATTTWNRQAWAADVAAAALMAEGGVQDFLIVGPWNNGPWRHAEYFPAGFLPHLPEGLRQRLVAEGLKGRPRSDDYLRFLVEELKPAVDARYATRPERQSTFLMGSSMGGLISAYGLCEHPAVFGGAACLSTHWIGTFERNAPVPAAALAYLRERLPDPDTVRWYMDRGTTELDALYDEAQPRIDALMVEKGYRAPAFVSRVFEGSGHNERAWAARLGIPMRHLMALAPGLG
jgi:enterochelin esterase-like enzyme